MTNDSEQQARAREVLLEQLPIGSDCEALRAAILDGSIALHSDPLSWVVEGAIAAMLAFADEARLAERERCIASIKGRAAEWRASMVGGSIGYAFHAERYAADLDDLATAIRKAQP